MGKRNGSLDSTFVEIEVLVNLISFWWKFQTWSVCISGSVWVRQRASSDCKFIKVSQAGLPIYRCDTVVHEIVNRGHELYTIIEIIEYPEKKKRIQLIILYETQSSEQQLRLFLKKDNHSFVALTDVINQPASYYGKLNSSSTQRCAPSHVGVHSSAHGSTSQL